MQPLYNISKKPSIESINFYLIFCLLLEFFNFNFSMTNNILYVIVQLKFALKKKRNSRVYCIYNSK